MQSLGYPCAGHPSLLVIFYSLEGLCVLGFEGGSHRFEKMGDYGTKRELSEEDVRVLKDHLRRQKAVFKLQVALLDQERMSVDLLRNAARRFQPADLDDLAEERMLNKLCGYPLCGKKPRKDLPKVRVVDAERKLIVSAEQARRFCSMDCLHRLELLKVQVPANSLDSRIDIPLMDGYTDTAKGDDSAKKEASVATNVKPEKVSSSPEATDESTTGVLKSLRAGDTVASLVTSTAPVLEREVDKEANTHSFPAPGSKVSTYAVEGYRTMPEDKLERAALVEKIKAKKQQQQQQPKPKETSEKGSHDAEENEESTLAVKQPSAASPPSAIAQAFSADTKPPSAPDHEQTAEQILAQLRELGINEDEDFAGAAKAAAAAAEASTSAMIANTADNQKPAIDNINKVGDKEDAQDVESDGLGSDDEEEEKNLNDVENALEDEQEEEEEEDDLDLDADMDLSSSTFSFFDVSTLSQDLNAFQFTPLMRFTDVMNSWTSPRSNEFDSGNEVDPITQSRAQVLHSNLSRACGIVSNALPSGRYYRSACQQALLDASSGFNHARPVHSFSAMEWQVLSAVMLHALVPTVESLDIKLLDPLRTFAISSERGKAKLEEAEFDSIASYVRISLAEAKAQSVQLTTVPSAPEEPLQSIPE